MKNIDGLFIQLNEFTSHFSRPLQSHVFLNTRRWVRQPKDQLGHGNQAVELPSKHAKRLVFVFVLQDGKLTATDFSKATQLRCELFYQNHLESIQIWHGFGIHATSWFCIPSWVPLQSALLSWSAQEIYCCFLRVFYQDIVFLMMLFCSCLIFPGWIPLCKSWKVRIGFSLLPPSLQSWTVCLSVFLA